MYNIKNITPISEKDYKGQSIPNGTIMVWNCDDWEDVEEGDDTDYESLNGELCVIQSLETYSSLGEQDFEYYNINFFNGRKLIGISGMYLKEFNH
jgi:hypothetical protein